MCKGGPHPRFRAASHFNPGLQSRGLWPYTYFAAGAIRLVRGSGASRLVSPRLPMRLDTGTFMSALPQRWLQALGGFLQLSGPPFPFMTAGGQGTGRVASGVQVQFTDDPCQVYPIDFLVMPGLDQGNYGLLSLRDVLNHFEVRTVGDLLFNARGQPTRLPELELIPRTAAS